MTFKEIKAGFIVEPDFGVTDSLGRPFSGPHWRSGNIRVDTDSKYRSQKVGQVVLSMEWDNAKETHKRTGSVRLTRSEAIELAMNVLESAFSIPKND